MTASDLVAAVRPVAEALEAPGVPYYFTGSVASSARGVARTSVDADIVAALDTRHVEPLIERLGSDYYIPVDRLRWAVSARSSCNLIHLATMFKIDIFVTKDRPFDREAARRARPDTIDDTPDAPLVPIASAEDTILAKRLRNPPGVRSPRRSTIPLPIDVDDVCLDSSVSRDWYSRRGRRPSPGHRPLLGRAGHAAIKCRIGITDL